MRIGIDMGHTLSGAGSSANGYVKESDKNREAGKRLIAMLKEKGHTVVDCTVDYSSNDLADRVAKANAQPLDLFISLHLNAFQMTTSEMGVETHIYDGSWSGKEANRAIAQKVQSALVSMVSWKDRKVKESNFYVLRNTTAPAILIELGFCDSKGDMDKWNTEKIAAAIFKGATGTDYIAPAPTPTPPSTGDTMYRVVCGSYSVRENAVIQQNKLKNAGYSSFLDTFQKDGKTFFRVIAGSYKDRANADRVMNELKAKGFDPFVAVCGEEGKGSTPTPTPTPPPVVNNDNTIIKEYAESGYAVPRTTVNVRNKPSVSGNDPVAKYSKGERFNYDKVVVTNAYTWVSYVSTSGARRYIAVSNKKTGERYVDCY